MDIQHLIEACHKQLARRQNSLKETLDELSLIEPLEASNPGAYTHAIAQLRTKRDRQAAAVKATEGLIKSFSAALTKGPKRP